MVTLTELAASKVQEIIQERGEPNLALRLFVQAGGCSGFSYGLGLDEAREDDNVVETEYGIKVLVDPESAAYVQGSVIDYKQALRGGGFAITNPNAVRTCGCGSSFRTAEEAGAADPC